MAKEVTSARRASSRCSSIGGTLLTKEIEIMNAVKAGNVAIGTPAGAAATVFPEMGVFLVPYLVRATTRPTRCSTARSATAR